LAPIDAAFFIFSKTHVDNLEQSMGDYHPIDTGIAASRDDSERLAWRQVTGLDDKLLLGADFQHLSRCRKNLSVSTEHLDAFRRILEMLDMIVDIESGKPHHSPVTALHAPHPVDGIGIDSADRGIEDDRTEYLQAGDVLARKPGSVGGCHGVILENERLQSAIFKIAARRGAMTN
jgi:hypothetical protein